MWEKSFEPSMLDKGRCIIINCQEEHLANELMSVLESYGIMWSGKEPPTNYSNWQRYKDNTCYWVEYKELAYADKEYAYRDVFAGFIKCTFRGMCIPDFDAATDEEMNSFLGF